MLWHCIIKSKDWKKPRERKVVILNKVRFIMLTRNRLTLSDALMARMVRNSTNTCNEKDDQRFSFISSPDGRAFGKKPQSFSRDPVETAAAPFKSQFARSSALGILVSMLPLLGCAGSRVQCRQGKCTHMSADAQATHVCRPPPWLCEVYDLPRKALQAVWVAATARYRSSAPSGYRAIARNAACRPTRFAKAASSIIQASRWRDGFGYPRNSCSMAVSRLPWGTTCAEL